MNTNKDWKMVPVVPTEEMLVALGGMGWMVQQKPVSYAAMLSAAPEAPPLNVTVDPDPRGVSVGVYLGSSCVYNGAHPILASTQTDARDWELTCDNCNGSGHVFVKHQVAERKTDVQEFKEECECCEGRGFTIAFEDIPGIAEYVKSCRPASTVATEGEKPAIDWRAVTARIAEYADDYELRGEDDHGREGTYTPNETERGLIIDAIHGLLADDEFMALMRPAAPAAGDARDAARYRELRNNVWVSGNEFRIMDPKLRYAAPRADVELDAFIDAIIAAPRKGDA